MRRSVIGKKADVQGAPDAAEAAADVTVKWKNVTVVSHFFKSAVDKIYR